jgi:hypothetical protein
MPTTLRIVLRGETNPDTVGAGRFDIIRKKLSSDEVTPPNVRFVPPDEEHPDGTMEQSYDGGETWIANPAIDPRHSIAYQFPPRGSSGDTTRCDAAANLTGALHSVIDILIAAPNAISAVNSWLSYVARFMPEIGFIITILTYIYDLLETLKPYLVDAFTTEVYDGIECLIYCKMDNSGRLDETGLSGLIENICGTYEETVCTVCQAILQTWWSTVGCSNAAAIGTLTGDCTSCYCGALCYTPSSEDNFPQARCTSATHYIAYDEVGAYTTVVYPNLQAAYVDLSLSFPLPTGAIGWKVTLTWIDGAIAEYYCATSYDASGASCAFGNVALTITSGLEQSVPSDHPVIWCSWFGDSGALHVTQVCIDADFG